MLVQPGAGQGADAHPDRRSPPSGCSWPPSSHASTSYLQVLVSLILIGTGMGISFVSLTTAALAGVAPADAGAASGLINVTQQLGAALGLAVLVTVFDSVTTPAGLGAEPRRGAPGPA